jgi:hypothetical protein
MAYIASIYGDPTPMSFRHQEFALTVEIDATPRQMAVDFAGYLALDAMGLKLTQAVSASNASRER